MLIKNFTSNFGPQYSAEVLKLLYKKLVNTVEGNILTICSVLLNFYQYAHINKHEAEMAFVKLKLEYLEKLIVAKQLEQVQASYNSISDYLLFVDRCLEALLVVLLVVLLYESFLAVHLLAVQAQIMQGRFQKQLAKP